MIHKDYLKMKSRWKMCRDAAAGEYEVHEAKTIYLPKLPQEDPTAYENRLLMTPWFNATWRTIIGLRGMMFRRPPKIVYPKEAEVLLSNIDNQGTTAKAFLQKVGLEALIVGRVGVLCDYTNTEGAVTKADLDKMRARPFAVMYATENILDWRYENNNGVRELTFVRLREPLEDHDKIELEETEELHRILELIDGKYQQRLVKSRVGNATNSQAEADIDIADSLKVVIKNNVPMDYIPFQFLGVDSLDGNVEAPPLIDLVTMNYHHYRQSSSYERGCFISGLPSLAVYGNHDDNKTLFLGGATANNFANPQAKMEFVEVVSEFNALVKNLDSKERMMAILGARMLEKQVNGVESEGALARKQSGEESILADMAATLEQGTTIVLRWLLDWAGFTYDEAEIQLTREFLPFSMDSASITAMMGAYIQRGVSYDTLYYNFEKAGMYPPGTNKEGEAGSIAETPPDPFGAFV